MTRCEELIKMLVPNIRDEAFKSLYIYYELLNQESKKYNLTTITGYEEVYIKHFYDSLLVGKVVDLNNKTIMDIGTGAGFPGIVLAIAYPNSRVILVEPTTKRCKFLELVIETLKLKNVLIINERAEKLDKKYRNSMDYVTARAVSNLQVLLELLTPYVKIDGYVVALKGSNVVEELNNAQKAILELNLEKPLISEFSLPMDLGLRSILVLKKIKKTKDIYPREYGKIKNKPL